MAYPCIFTLGKRYKSAQDVLDCLRACNNIPGKWKSAGFIDDQKTKFKVNFESKEAAVAATLCCQPDN